MACVFCACLCHLSGVFIPALFHHPRFTPARPSVHHCLKCVFGRLIDPPGVTLLRKLGIRLGDSAVPVARPGGMTIS